ncbi:MAG TPA: RIP metalloprotease RseP [Terriglobia bacterium]|nr:RIP metalloprotease RseP [Terriglobia bacterium]
MNALSNFFTDAAVVIVVLGLLVFVHEAGHFLVAKLCGVRVMTFSFGFGQRLFGVKRGAFTWGKLTDEEPSHTDYRLSLLPLGGYVKMAGENLGEVQGQVQESTPSPDEFPNRPRWQRFLIMVAGPAMNVALAVLMLAAVYKVHFEKPAYAEQPARVGYVESDSPAAKAGIVPGDLIVLLGTDANPKWEDVVPAVATSAGHALPVEVVRDGRRISLTLVPKAEGPDELGFAGWLPDSPPIVGPVEPDFPAAKAGLKTGDRIVALDGKKIPDSAAVVRALQDGAGKTVDLTVQRAGQQLDIPVEPVYTTAAGDNEKKWRIGVSFREEEVVRQLPWGLALANSVDDNVRSTLETFNLLGKLLTRQVSPRSLSGPVGIAQISGEYYREGIATLIPVVAYLSLQLGIFNLLPIPILDGGGILLLLIEGVIRRDLSLKVKERVIQVGMAVLLLLVVFVTYNDIMKSLRPY